MRTVMVLLLLSLGLAACNTMQGLGKDIEQGGQAIERASKK